MWLHVPVPGNFNVLVSSAGRRVQLIDGFRAALRTLGVSGSVFAADASESAAAFQLADRAFLVPRLDNPGYIAHLRDVCESEGVSLLVPTIDTELAQYSKVREQFAATGTCIAVSSPACIEIAHSKRATHHWLVQHGFPTVDQIELGIALGAPEQVDYPLVIKPDRGSMSVGVRIIETQQDFPAQGDDDLVVQSFARGEEFTVSVLMNSSQRCRAAVPRKRLEVRAGEVSKAITVRDTVLEDLAVAIAEALPGAFGALNVQMIKDPETNAVNVIEINARFGGGDPLAWAAGANFPLWMIEELLGRGAEPRLSAWADEFQMYRFDRAVYRSREGSKFVG